jgi:hypothetical protein
MGLGMVCGPLLAVMSAWRHEVPGGWMVVTTMTFGLGIFIFSYCEQLSTTDAIYATVITGTTIGYGDVTPSTDLGKLGVAIFALLAVGVVTGMLETVRDHLMGFCIPSSSTTTITAAAAATSKSSSSSSAKESSTTTTNSASQRAKGGSKANRKAARMQQQTNHPGQETKPKSSSATSSTLRKRR